jgi:hypothetical protein
MRNNRSSLTDERSSTIERNLGESLLRNMKESIILQMISFEYDISSRADDQHPLDINNFDSAQIDIWYAKACQVETRVEKLTFGSFGERIAITKVCF